MVEIFILLVTLTLTLIGVVVAKAQQVVVLVRIYIDILTGMVDVFITNNLFQLVVVRF